MIETNIEKVRDPFVLVDENAYYLYGTKRISDWRNTDWICYKNVSGSLNGEWEVVDKPLYIRPDNAETNFWAPEVYKYNGAYYMFASYYSSKTEHRGCSVLKSDSPEGPFKEITDGHITPKEWDAIDGSLYIDSDDQLWMVFVHEWTSTDDGVGSMAIAKLSDDFTRFVSEPIELFKADEPKWADRNVTDGCFIYRTEDGQVLMLWSNFSGMDYCVGIARCNSGDVCGEWVHDETLLFSPDISGKFDGGHGMIFKDNDGKKYLCVHSPNTPTEEMNERIIFVPVCEKNGTLVCEI